MISGLVDRLENGQNLENFLNDEVLKKLDSEEKTESDFHVLIWGAAAFAALNGTAKHAVQSEAYVSEGERIDNLFIPLENKGS